MKITKAGCLAVLGALAVAGCGGSAAPAPAVTVTASASPAATVSAACRTATSAVTAARVEIAGAGLGGGDSVPALKAAEGELSRAGHAVEDSGVPLMHTKAGTIGVDLAMAATAAAQAMLMIDLGKSAAARRALRQLRGLLARLTKECGSVKL